VEIGKSKRRDWAGASQEQQKDGLLALTAFLRSLSDCLALGGLLSPAEIAPVIAAYLAGKTIFARMFLRAAGFWFRNVD